MFAVLPPVPVILAPAPSSCRSRACKRRVWRRQHPGPRLIGRTFGPSTSTWYATGGCDPSGGGNITASGVRPRFGMVAQSTMRFGTRIFVWPAILGRHVFSVQDRFGSPQASGRLDVWVPCGSPTGNPVVRFRVIG